MNFYPKKISEKFHSPQNGGTVAEANAVGTSATFVCGAVLRLTLQIGRQNKKIEQAKFKTSGCGFLIAASDLLAEKIVGRRLNEPRSLDNQILKTEIESELGAFPGPRQHCLAVVTDALRLALANYRTLLVEEFAGEKALICTCFGVSEETIENLVVAESLTTVEDVTDACRAGGGCGSCQPLIQEIIDTAESTL